jgi:hypothetical protein
LRLVLAEIGFPAEAIDWHTTRAYPADRQAAEDAAVWILQGALGRCA